MDELEASAISVIQSLGFIRHPVKLGFWVEPYREVLIRHRNLLRWARESADLRKRIIDEVGRLLGKRAHDSRRNPIDPELVNAGYPDWETRQQFWGPLASPDDGRGGVWAHSMDWGSPAWKKKMDAHYHELGKQLAPYKFEVCPRCGTQHTIPTLCCRNCNYCNRPQKYRRNMDEDLRKKLRAAQQGTGSAEEYLWALRRAGQISEEEYQQAEKYLAQQKFAFLFEPTTQQIMLENHQCHGDQYPGHCCIQNLRPLYERDGETELGCRECQDIIASEDSDGYTVWTEDDRRITCSMPPDDPDNYI